MEEVSNIVKKTTKKARHRKKHLYSQILSQMEFYFSDSNLSKDRFLSQLLSESSEIDIKVFLTFNKIQKLDCTIDDICKALSKSDLIELCENDTKIRRKKPIKVKENIDECTIYVENIKSDVNHEWLTQIFSEYGNVVYVSIPKYKHNKVNKGFAFVEFENEKGATDALAFFESIGCKMPLDISPEELKSIATFEGETYSTPEGLKEKATDLSGQDKVIVEEESKKRRLSDEAENPVDKKLKTENTTTTETQNDVKENKKKKKKEDKKKNMIKDLGLQVLPKKEWKKMRNQYLNLQKKKMKEFKQYLYKQKFSKEVKADDKSKQEKMEVINKGDTSRVDEKAQCTKFDFVPGIIVMLKLPEPYLDAKKIKNELKTQFPHIQYIDTPTPSGGEEVILRFDSSENAKEFCKVEGSGQKVLLENEEEQLYWEKIRQDRDTKFAKNNKKQRGRDKLLKKAEKERSKHLRFDETE